jgi:uncharacterized protein (DUF1697 family)
MAPVTRYGLLIRGVNVGTSNSLPMAELRSMLEEDGCSEVRTYVQSGNAVFSSELDERALSQAIEGRLAGYMGRPIATTLRTAAEFRTIVAGRPFASEIANDPKHFAVTFLSEELSPEALGQLTGAEFGAELVHVVGREIYSWHPAGLGRSALAQTLSRLPGPGTRTTRNWNTVVRLAAMLDEPSLVDDHPAAR